MLLLDPPLTDYADLTPLPIDELIDDVEFTIDGKSRIQSQVVKWCKFGVAIVKGKRSRPLPHFVEDGEYYVSVAEAIKWNAEVTALQVASGVIDPLKTLDFDPAPCEKTDAIPGSPEKIEVLAKRWRDKQSMHHDLDMSGVAGKMSDSGRQVDSEIVDRAVEFWKRGESVLDISDRLGVSSTAVRLWTRGIDREVEEVIEPWLLKNERAFLDFYAGGKTYDYSRQLSGPFNTDRLLKKLGIESRDDLLVGYEEYKRRQAGIEKREHEEARRQRDFEDLKVSAVRDLLADVLPNCWDNLDVYRLYELIGIATRGMTDFHLREDVTQDLVALAPTLISRMPCKDDAYIVKMFRRRSRWISNRNYRSALSPAKDQAKNIVQSVERLKSHNNIQAIEIAGLTHCPACGKLTYNKFCGPRCSTKVISYRTTLQKAADDCHRLLDACDPRGFVSRDKLMDATGFSMTGFTAVMAALHCLGYKIELSEAGYQVSGLSRLDQQTTWLKSPGHISPVDLATLKSVGVRFRRNRWGEYSTDQDLTIAQQLMAYRLFPWSTNCVICGIDTIPEKPEALTGNMRMSMTCTEKCQSKLGKLRVKGWQV